MICRSALLTIFAVGNMFAMTGCGFAPLHMRAQGLQGGGMYNNLDIELLAPANLSDKRAGFLLRQYIVQRTGETSEPARFRVRLKVRAWQRRLGLSGEDVSSRYDINMQADYELIESQTDTVLNKGRVQSTTSFGAPTDPYGLEAAESHALEIIAADVADRVLARLAAYATSNGSVDEN